MDVDRYITVHRPAWDRLAYLSRRARRGARRLDPAELDELVHLYQRVSGHLSHARTTYADPGLVTALTRIVADANAAIYSTRASAPAAIRRFFRETFPGSVWRIRWFVLAAAVLTLLPALVVGGWIATSDAALEASGPEAVRAAYVAEDFEAYYSSAPAAQFAAEVTFNNIRVSILAFALGIFGCVGTAAVLVFNGGNVGVAGAAGLRLGWALIDPGDRRRAVALTEEARRSINVVLGLIIVFVVAGTIEGFVTGSPLPTGVRVGVGVAVEVGFLTYVVAYGRASEAQSRPVAFMSR